MTNTNNSERDSLIGIIKECGGIVHKDGNIFFSGLDKLLDVISALAHKQEAPEAETIDSEDFYNICQKYRHADDNGNASKAFEDLIKYIDQYKLAIKAGDVQAPNEVGPLCECCQGSGEIGGYVHIGGNEAEYDTVNCHHCNGTGMQPKAAAPTDTEGK